MGIEDRRNYWQEEILADHETWLQKARDYVAIIIVLCLVAGVFYMWGRKDGINWVTDEACSTGSGRYYLKEVCDGR
jgi:hypothetical protein